MGRLGDRLGLLDVVGDDDRGDGALRQRDPASPIDEVADLRRLHRDLDEFVGDVLEQGRQVDLLLVIAPESGPGLLPHDRDHRLMVELGVVQAVEQMDGSGARRRQAHAHLARELGVRAGHERRHLLVADLDELRPLAVARARERAHHAVDPVPRVPVYAAHAPGGETVEEVVAYCLAHPVPVPFARFARAP